MTLPANFTTALAGRAIDALCWVEIDGCAYAFGNFAADSTWFASRAAGSQFSGILPALVKMPTGAEQQVSLWEGRSSGASWQIEIADIDGSGSAGTMTEIHSARRLDGRLYCVDSDWLSTSATGWLDYQDPDAADAGWPSSGYAWVDREVVAFDDFDAAGDRIHVTGRARLGTTAATHAGDSVVAGGTRIRGTAITPYPTFLASRLARGYLLLSRDHDDSDKVCRFAGEVTASRMGDGGQSFLVSVASSDRRIGGWMAGARSRGALFENQRTAFLIQAIP